MCFARSLLQERLLRGLAPYALLRRLLSAVHSKYNEMEVDRTALTLSKLIGTIRIDSLVVA
jgi:hypothetical protein